MACFDSNKSNPKLVRQLVNVLPNGHYTSSDVCRRIDREECALSYHCTDAMSTKIRAYGTPSECREQVFVNKIELGHGPLTGSEINCHAMPPRRSVVGDGDDDLRSEPA